MKRRGKRRPFLSEREVRKKEEEKERKREREKEKERKRKREREKREKREQRKEGEPSLALPYRPFFVFCAFQTFPVEKKRIFEKRD